MCGNGVSYPQTLAIGASRLRKHSSCKGKKERGKKKEQQLLLVQNNPSNPTVLAHYISTWHRLLELVCQSKLKKDKSITLIYATHTKMALTLPVITSRHMPAQEVQIVRAKA